MNLPSGLPGWIPTHRLTVAAEFMARVKEQLPSDSHWKLGNWGRLLGLVFGFDICEDFPIPWPEVGAQFRRHARALIGSVSSSERHVHIVAKGIFLRVAIDALAAGQVRSVRLDEERRQVHELAFVVGFATDRESAFERASILGKLSAASEWDLRL